MRFREIFLIAVIWRCLLFIIVGVAPYWIVSLPDFIGYGFHLSGGPIWWPWANFDGEHYLWISQHGYRGFEYAFFPMYPMLIRVVNLVFQDPVFSGLLVSNVAFFIFLYLLYKLMLENFSRSEVWRGIILMLAFPTAFFMGADYSESVFLALSVGFFLALLKKNFFWIGVLGAMTTLTRVVGLTVGVVVFFYWLKSGFRNSRYLFCGIVILIAFIGVMVFNFLETGDAIAFASAQSHFNASRSATNLVLPLRVGYRYIKIFLTADVWSLQYLIAVIEFVATSAAFLSIALFWRRMKAEYLIWCIGVLIIPVVTGTLSSMPRYVLAAFPLWFYIASKLKGVFYWIVVSAMFVLQIVLLVLFANGRFVS